MLNNILNGTSRTGSSTASRNDLTSVRSSTSSTTARGSYQGRSGSTSTGTTNTGISVVEKRGDNFITVHANGNDYIIENMTATEFNAATRGYTTAQSEEFARMHATKTGTTPTGGGTTTTPPPTDTGGGTTTTTPPPTDTGGGTTTTTPPPTDTGGTTTEEESDNTLMYILIAAIVGVALFPTGKKKKKKK